MNTQDQRKFSNEQNMRLNHIEELLAQILERLPAPVVTAPDKPAEVKTLGAKKTKLRKVRPLGGPDSAVVIERYEDGL